jgi:tetratricopeptide (TPR) repeat protein
MAVCAAMSRVKRTTGRVIVAVVAALLALSTNVASTLVPAEWTRHHALVVWIAFGVLVVLWATFDVLTPPDAELGERFMSVGNKASAPVTYIEGDVYVQSQLPAPAPAQAEGQIVVGELPGTPPVFIARSAVDNLHAVFASGASVATVTTVSGSRGAGKTQVAAEYARRAITESVPLVAWVSAEDQGRLLAGLAEVASRLGVADPEGDSERSAARLRDELATRAEPGVLVLDNATDPDAVRPYLPSAGSTQILITTTNRGFASMGSEILVQPFDREQSVAYLMQRTGLDNKPGAETVADALGNLPLALGQAATVIKLRGWSFSTYLKRHEELPLEDLLPADRGDAYPHGTAKAILLSVTAVEEDDPTGTTTHVLDTIALLSPDGVSRAIVSQVAGLEPAPLDEILGHLVVTSLLVWTTDHSAVVMHRLVGRALRDRLESSAKLATAVKATFTGLGPLMVSPNEAWQLREATAEVVDHTLALWDTVVRAADHQILSPTDVSGAAPLAHWRVVHLRATADLSRAIDAGISLMNSLEHLLGPDHRDTLASRNDLAECYRSTGNLGEALSLCEANLADSERIVGLSHPDTLRSRNNLAGIYEIAGDLDRAISLYESNLADSERILGPDHPNTLASRNNLAYTYQSAGSLDRAIPLYEANLADRERIVGGNHPDTLISRNNVASAYEAAGDLDRAIPLYKTNLADSERILGLDHPDTLASRNNLAGAYEAAGDLDQAIPLYKTTLADSERILGLDHPDTLSSRNNLAGAYETAGDLDQAIPLYETTLADSERVLGLDHPDTLASRNNLAYTYWSAGDPEQAIPLYKDALAVAERVLSPGHPTIWAIRQNLKTAEQSGPTP